MKKNTLDFKLKKGTGLCKVLSLYTTNIITCNKTNPDGSVVNVLEDNAELARKRVDEIRL